MTKRHGMPNTLTLEILDLLNSNQWTKMDRIDQERTLEQFLNSKLEEIEKTYEEGYQLGYEEGVAEMDEMRQESFEEGKEFMDDEFRSRAEKITEYINKITEILSE